MYAMFQEWLRNQQGQNTGHFGNKGGGKGQVILDERHFRKLKIYDGALEKYRLWTFNFLVALGRIDGKLASEIRKLLPRVSDDHWTPQGDAELDQDVYELYKEELFGVLVDNTDGDALTVVKSVVDKGFGEDGFKAMADLSQRLDSKTVASLCRPSRKWSVLSRFPNCRT